MSKISKYGLINNDKIKASTNNLNSPGKHNINTPFSITISKRDNYYNVEYLEINQFKEYRDAMLKKIDAEQINNSFLEIRQLINSLKDVVMDTKTKEPNFKTSVFHPNSKSVSPSLPKTQPNESDYYEGNSSLLRSKGSPLSISKTKGKGRKDQISKLLTNLHIYINNNLSEINDIKNSIKPNNIEKNFGFPSAPRLDLIESQASKQEERSKNNMNIEDPLLLNEKKIHKIEVEKLLSKIKLINEKQKKVSEKIETMNKEEKTLHQNINKAMSIVRTKISGFIHEDVWGSEPDKKKFFTNLIYESYVVLILKTSLIFYKSLSDEKDALIIDSSSIVDVIYYKKELPLDLNSSDVSDFEQDFSHNEDNFNGFQIKFSNKNYLFLRINSILDMLKLDNFFFLSNLFKTNPNLEIFFKFSRTCYANSMNIIHDMYERNFSPSIKKGNASPSMTDLDISNISNYPTEKRSSINRHETGTEKQLLKKKSIFHQNNENLNKKIKTKTIAENNIFGAREKSQQKMNDMTKSNPSFKESEFVNNNILRKNSLLEKKDPQSKLLKAVKALKNGYMFLKYGKYGDSHERLLFLSEKNLLEWRDINKKKSNGFIEISQISEVKDDLDPKSVKKPINIMNSAENNVFSITSKSKHLTLTFESGTEKIKKEFIESLKLVISSDLTGT